MKIAIIGTRGIPNNYGGFEQLAEYLSLGLKEKGHDVYVYSSDKHSYKESTWRGINIIHKYDPEKKIGTMGQFIYDLNSILNSRKHKFDVILNLGYTSSSIWMRLFSKKTVVITNMDGLEWKRTKYSKKVQRFLKYAERLAVKLSDILVADSMGIQSYLYKKYGVQSHYIAYGAELFINPDASVLKPFNVEPYSYNMLIARMEPENNIEMILDGVSNASNPIPFFVIGNYSNKFGTYLKLKYKANDRIIFLGSIYDAVIINNLRYYSNLYFHGHSVGGTNPSLLEAMGCKCLIAAHDNEFNRGVLREDAIYFSHSSQVTQLLASQKNEEKHQRYILNNYQRVEKEYSWNKIVEQYENVMLQK
jgi:glycosyltransferase involved in cell wall biosynthesis